MLTAVKKTDLVFPFTPLTFRLSYFALSQRKCSLTYRPSSSEATVVARDVVACLVGAAVPEERQLIHLFIRKGNVPSPLMCIKYVPEFWFTFTTTSYLSPEIIQISTLLTWNWTRREVDSYRI